MKFIKILLECDELIIGEIKTLILTGLYEGSFPVIFCDRIKLNKKVIKDSGVFFKGEPLPANQEKLLKIRVITTDSDDFNFKEEIIYPNVLLFKSSYIYTDIDYILDEVHFIITGS